MQQFKIDKDVGGYLIVDVVLWEENHRFYKNPRDKDLIFSKLISKNIIGEILGELYRNCPVE